MRFGRKPCVQSSPSPHDVVLADTFSSASVPEHHGLQHRARSMRAPSRLLSSAQHAAYARSQHSVRHLMFWPDARVASGLSTGGFGSSAPSANRASATAIPQAPNQADLQRVVSSIPIALYEADWCPHCRRAKAWFGAQRLNVTDYDVDHDAQAKQALVRYNPRGSLPTIVVGDRVLVGFSEDAVTRTLAAIASQKLGARVTARVSEPGH